MSPDISGYVVVRSRFGVNDQNLLYPNICQEACLGKQGKTCAVKKECRTECSTLLEYYYGGP